MNAAHGTNRNDITVRELAYTGVFGAAALLLPILFHVLQLGRIFMPMYLPLVTLAFFVRPLPAAATGIVTPLVSGVLTGMPPFYPPVAVLMAIELGLTAFVVSVLNAHLPRAKPWLLLAPVLLGGRLLYVGLVYGFARIVELPAGFVAGASLLSGWPGVVLMLVVIPPLVLGVRGRRPAGRAAQRATTAGETRRQFFDRIAPQWDGWIDLEQMAQLLRGRLQQLRIERDARVVDLGCGTGNLTLALLAELGPEGQVVAVDFSNNMLSQAQHKVADPRVQWVAADAAELPMVDAQVDRVVCFSAWPHFPDPARVLDEVRRVLRPAGELCIWHAEPRQVINEIHARVGPPVDGDRLPPAPQLVTQLRAAGLEPLQVVDDAECYLVRARVPPAGG